MSAPEVVVDADLLEDIARVNGALVTFTSSAAFCTVDGTTFTAPLPSVERAS